MSNIFKTILLIPILYLFLFQGIIGRYFFISVEILITVLFFSKTIKRTLPLFEKELIFCGCIAFYSVMTDLLHGEMVYSDRFLASFFQGYFVSAIIASWILKRQYFTSNFENILIVVAGVASLITLTAILYPPFDAMIASINYDYTNMLERYANFDVRYRAYGLSENLTFSYPYVLAVIGGFIIMERRNLYTIGVFLMIVIAVMFNARIAFLPLLFSIPFLIIRKRADFTFIFKSAIFVAVFWIAMTYVFDKYTMLNNSWAFTFFDELEGSTGGSGSMYTLFGKMVFLPDESFFTLIFGTGESVFLSAKRNSDMGWVLQIYYGGFVLLLMIVFYMLYLFRRTIKVLHIKHWFTLMFIFSLPILNTKGFFFASTPGCRLFTFLYVYYIMKRVYEKKNNNSKIVYAERTVIRKHVC